MSTRDEFEAWISATQDEIDTARYPGWYEEKWPAEYRDETTQQAWEAWEETTKRAYAEIERLRKREAHLTEMIDRHERDVQRAFRGQLGHYCAFRNACERIQNRASGRDQ